MIVLMLLTLTAEPDYSLWEARISSLEQRADQTDAAIVEIRDDISAIRRMLAEKPTKAPAPEVIPAPLVTAKAEEKIVVLTAPFYCAPCEALKSRLREAGKSFSVRVAPNRSSWPGLLVDGREVSQAAYFGGAAYGDPRIEPSVASVPVMTTVPVSAGPVRRAVRRRRGPLGILGRIFGGKRRRGLVSPVMMGAGGSCGCLEGGYSCGNPSCHQFGAGTCSCRG